MDIAQGQIGPEATYEIDIENGKFTAKGEFTGTDGGGGAHLYLNAAKVIDKLHAKVGEPLKKLIPGGVDDAFIDILFAKMKELVA